MGFPHLMVISYGMEGEVVGSRSIGFVYQKIVKDLHCVLGLHFLFLHLSDLLILKNNSLHYALQLCLLLCLFLFPYFIILMFTYQFGLNFILIVAGILYVNHFFFQLLLKNPCIYFSWNCVLNLYFLCNLYSF